MSIKSTAGVELAIQNGRYEGFRYEVINPSTTTAALKIFIPQGQSMKAIPGCMFATSSNIEIKGKVKKSLKAIFGPDNALYQTLTAKDRTGEGWVILSPGFYGSITPIKLINNEELCVGGNAFLCALGNVDTTRTLHSYEKARFSVHGMFVRRVKGTGVIFVCAVGSLLTFELGYGEGVTIDNGHIVTWPSSINYEFHKAATSWFGSGISGEGIVTKITGPGVINVQTRNLEEVADLMEKAS